MPSTGTSLRYSRVRNAEAKQAEQANPKEQGISPVDYEISLSRKKAGKQANDSGRIAPMSFNRITVAITTDNENKKSGTDAV
jgi:hypothetical protein